MKTVCILLTFVALTASASAAKTDKTECEACVKVIEDVRATLKKDDLKSKPAIETALGNFCARDNLNPREKKLCYYMDPVKRDIAQPFSLGMPALKVCQRISKSNPEICTVKFPVETKNLELKDLNKLRVKQLKQILSERGVDCKGCIEKEEFIKKIQATEHLSGVEL